MTSEQLNDTWQILQNQRNKYCENKAYVDGKNPELFNEPAKKDPDNRVPVPFARATVNDMTGYSGKNINVFYENISTENEEEEKETEYNDILQQVQKHNDDKLLMSEVYKETLTQKEAYLLFWVSDELNLEKGMMTPEYQLVTMKEMVIFESNTLKPYIEKAVRFVEIDKETIEAIVYYPEFAKSYTKKGEGWERNSQGDVSYPYKRVPVIKFKMSREGGAIFEPQKRLIDSHDKAISKAQNEIDRFNALIALFPGKVTKEFVDKLEQLKVIDELSNYEKWPEYLEKNLQGVEIYLNKQLDRLERLYHKTIEVPDMTSQDFSSGGAEAAAARALRFISMEFLAADIESYFKKGFQERTKLFNDVIEASTINLDVMDYNTKVVMVRNFPIDEAAKVMIATQLKALGVRNETIFRFLPDTIIEDVEKELAEVEENQDEDIFDE